MVFRRSTSSDDAARGDGAESVEAASEILRGGAWIGVLERAAVYAAIVGGLARGHRHRAGRQEPRPLPRAAGRHSSAAAERFIIGTFVSTLFACACAGVALLARTTLSRPGAAPATRALDRADRVGRVRYASMTTGMIIGRRRILPPTQRPTARRMTCCELRRCR